MSTGLRGVALVKLFSKKFGVFGRLFWLRAPVGKIEGYTTSLGVPLFYFFVSQLSKLREHPHFFASHLCCNHGSPKAKKPETPQLQAVAKKKQDE